LNTFWPGEDARPTLAWPEPASYTPQDFHSQSV
jgi:hypothetical protein